MDEEWKRASNRKQALDKQQSVFSQQESKFSCLQREKKMTKRQKLDGTGSNILYSNVNGLMNKMDKIRTCLCVYEDINVICITETHLKKSVLDAEIEIEGYKCFRKDRNFSIKNNDIDYLQELFNYTLCCNSVKEQLTMLKMYMQGQFRHYNDIFT